ncbi:amastin-like surface protein-like protein [Angomonas deanei]|uniref:Amastin surface glycoprotein, putative n=1 Tax=Angomonas deanei TaxID=59799 RepID=A0A7G2CJA9_9TRYP|nr:amastin-like surface protein-like protein [Angomonas deanei]CAD2219866.1 Amastin surface glycoprotein, putative [Angomonas deanei]|eukprot:EPY28710.1 amastin-like surface protein-like protein [Angomonas deanei]
MGVLSGVIAGIIYTILQAIVFIFVLVATPIDMFKPKNNNFWITIPGWSPAGRGSCYTMWGYKTDCSSTKYTSKGTAAFGCGRRRNNMNGAAAFAIISIFLTLVALVFGILLICKCLGAIVPLILSIIAMVTILISWACVAGVYTQGFCGGNPYKTNMKYGAGFGLLVTAWCLEVILVIFLIVFCIAC